MAASISFFLFRLSRNWYICHSTNGLIKVKYIIWSDVLASVNFNFHIILNLVQALVIISVQCVSHEILLSKIKPRCLCEFTCFTE